MRLTPIPFKDFDCNSFIRVPVIFFRLHFYCIILYQFETAATARSCIYNENIKNHADTQNHF